ncbi:NACHT, LRR and PYD domains-containing protein 1b allele 2-like [Pyxicephalus adspersus]|uniref:NACHT, LRR and PYD domains-containing protein 1b allele 2-like n=1 Tax=Pyxicephalus adspersus TaxID=30357 RepID=UPI003B5C39A8
MASAVATCELCSSVCNQIFTDSIALKCGHSFCQTCFVEKKKGQEQDGFYTCPKCRKRSLSENRKRKLSDSEWRQKFTHKTSTVYCMYCNSAISAVKTCLQCEGSLCEEHLAAHNRERNHRLIDPTSLENRKCTKHTKLLEYYCTEDGECICADCCVFGDHKGHDVEKLEEASEKKKEKMKKVQENLVCKKEETNTKINKLTMQENTAQIKCKAQEEQVNEQIEKVKEEVLQYISGQRERDEQIFLQQINKLKTREQKLVTRIDAIEELCNTNDPLCVLQDWAVDEEEIGNWQEMEDTEIPNHKGNDINRLLQCLNRNFSNILQDLHTQNTSHTGGLAEDNIHNGHSTQTNGMDIAHKHQDFTEEKMDPVINKGTYRLDIKSAGLFECSKTQMKFLVNCPLTIEYNMVDWKNYLTENDKNNYETMSPLFNIKTSARPHEISAVYLPHSLHPKNFEINKPYLKCACFEDRSLNWVLPKNVEPSHVVLENPTYSLVGVLMENSQTRERKQAQSYGTVLIYCKPVTKHFLVHVYLVPLCKSSVKKAIKTKETRCGFRWIDKPPFIPNVSKNITYVIKSSGGVMIENKDLHCLNKVTEQYPYAEIRIPERYPEVHLHISEKGEETNIWSCVLTNEDLTGMNETPSTSISHISPSDSEKAKTFLQKNYEDLCNRLGLLHPLLVSLNGKGIINGSEEELITKGNLAIKQNKALLDMVKSKGVEAQFYQILKDKDPCLVQDLEQPS